MGFTWVCISNLPKKEENVLLLTCPGIRSLIPHSFPCDLSLCYIFLSNTETTRPKFLHISHKGRRKWWGGVEVWVGESGGVAKWLNTKFGLSPPPGLFSHKEHWGKYLVLFHRDVYLTDRCLNLQAKKRQVMGGGKGFHPLCHRKYRY